MPPPTNPNAEAVALEAAAHSALLQRLDINHLPKPFRSTSWKPNQRRNKNIKTILGDASRKEASSMMSTQDNSGAATPSTLEGEDEGPSTEGEGTGEGDDTPMTDAGASPQKAQPNLAKASRDLSKLVLENNLKNRQAGANASSLGAPGATYTNIESAPTLAPTKHYCDITGLPAPYTDPKTRLRYANKEVFQVARGLGQGVAEMYLEARGAHTILR